MGYLVGAAVALVAVAVAIAVWMPTALERAVDARLRSTDDELRRLGDADRWRERGSLDARREITEFRGALEELRARDEERRGREDEVWGVLHRVAGVLAGGQRTGRAGENVLRDALAHLPPSMIVNDFRVNGRVVEFGLILPDGRRLPIDSKWPSDRELIALQETDDPAEIDRLGRLIERTVTERAREVAQYRDPSVTAPVGVAAVPDAAYAVLRRAHADAYRQGVIVVPYSMALPIVLFLHGLVSRFGSAGDVDDCLRDLSALLDAMESTLENKLARASTMLSNGAEELRAEVGKARATLARTGGGAEQEGEPRPRLVGIRP